MILFLILFGIFYHSTLGKAEETKLSLSGVTVPIYTASDSLRFLFIYDAELNGEDLFCAVICCSALDHTITLCEIPLQLEALNHNKRQSLREHYRLRGTDGLRTATENLLQSELDAVIRTDKQGLLCWVDAIGGLPIRQNDLMQYPQQQVLSAYRLIGSFSDPANRRILLQRLIAYLFSEEDALLSGKQLLFRYCETDFTDYMALEHQQAMKSLLGCTVTITELSVKRSGIGGQIVAYPDGESLTELRRVLRRS